MRCRCPQVIRKIQLLMLVYDFLWPSVLSAVAVFSYLGHTFQPLCQIFLSVLCLPIKFKLRGYSQHSSVFDFPYLYICFLFVCFIYKSVPIEWTEHLSLFDEISLRCSAMTQTLWKAGRLLRLSADALWGVMAFSCSHSSSSHFVFDVACLPYPRALKV